MAPKLRKNINNSLLAGQEDDDYDCHRDDSIIDKKAGGENDNDKI